MAGKQLFNSTPRPPPKLSVGCGCCRCVAGTSIRPRGRGSARGGAPGHILGREVTQCQFPLPHQITVPEGMVSFCSSAAGAAVECSVTLLVVCSVIAAVNSRLCFRTASEAVAEPLLQTLHLLPLPCRGHHGQHWPTQAHLENHHNARADVEPAKTRAYL